MADQQDQSQNSAVESEEERLLRAAARHSVDKVRPPTPTGMLDEEDRQRLPFASSAPYGLAVNSNHYQPLPRELPANIDPAQTPSWCIEICGIATHRAPIGIEVRGDVVLGVDRGDDPRPDLDLGQYGGNEKGVSRRHALLRPTRNRLYLIDLKSTNGTNLNALPVGPGMAMEVRNGDTLSLGNLNFTIRVVLKPGATAAA